MSPKPRSHMGPAVVGTIIGFLLAVHVIPGGGVDLKGSIIALIVLAFVVQPLATLGHELGHALAALLLGGRPSLIVVGRGPFIRVRAEPTVILFSVLPTRGVPFAGVCRYDRSELPWRSVALIALAGPLATFVELLAMILLGAELWESGSLVQMLFVLTGVSLVASLVVNLWPHQDLSLLGKVPAMSRDGDVARYAYARHRARATAVT